MRERERERERREMGVVLRVEGHLKCVESSWLYKDKDQFMMDNIWLVLP